MKLLGKEIRQRILSLTEIPITDEEDIDELKDFIFFEDSSGENSNDKDAEKNPETFKVGKLKPKLSKKLSTKKKGKKGGSSNSSGGGQGTGQGTGKGTGDGDGGRGNKGKTKRTQLLEPRNILGESDTKRTLFFTPTANGDHKIYVLASGLKDTEVIGLKKTDIGKIKDGALMLTCLLYTSPSPRDKRQSRMPSSA